MNFSRVITKSIAVIISLVFVLGMGQSFAEEHFYKLDVSSGNAKNPESMHGHAEC